MAAAAITGLDQVNQVLMALPEAVRLNVLSDATFAGAEVIRAGASARAPRLTGQLAGDIQIVIILERGGAVAKVGPSKRSFYGLFQERGTSHQRAYPFLRPALDEDGPKAQEAMMREIARGVEEQAARLHSGGTVA
jgi:HK97 gp10 family phage protein